MFGSIKKLFNRSKQLKQLLNEGAIVIDVRTPLEFKSGHLPGSRNIPLDILSTRISELKELNKPVITVCRSGSRSGVAKEMLVAAGIKTRNGGSWTNLRTGA